MSQSFQSFSNFWVNGYEIGIKGLLFLIEIRLNGGSY